MISRRKLIEKDYVLYLIDYFGRMQTWKQEDVLSEIARKVKEAKPVYQPQTVGIDKQKLIEELENRFLVDDNMTWNEAMCFVIDAIKSQPPADQWIPCIVKLPEKSGEYWVTIIWSNKPTTSTGRYDAEKKMWDRYSYDPIAWKPYTYPEPYKGE